MKSFESLAGALDFLKEKGFETEMKIGLKGLKNPETQMITSFKEIKILKTVQVEPQVGDNGKVLVFGILLKDGSKGIFTDFKHSVS